MPILVDRERQREHVALMAARVIAEEGVSALTFRRMAAEAGTSTAIVSTYFADKQDLLLMTYESCAERGTRRFDAAVAAGGGLQECLEAWLPLDDERVLDWRVFIAFWGVAVSDPRLAAIQDGYMDRARRLLEELIVATRPTRRVTAEVATTAQLVLALTLGIAAQAVFVPVGGPPVPQRQLLADGLAGLTSRPRTIARRT